MNAADGKELPARGKGSWGTVGMTVATLLVLVAPFAYVLWVQPQLGHRPTTGPELPSQTSMGPIGAMPTPFVWPGINQPPAVPADRAGLEDDAEVIGVVAEGKPRAYLVKAFSGPTRHVVNDLLGVTPVTVTHCDRTKFVKVLTDKPAGKPLDVYLGGWKHDMLLKVKDRFYSQKTGKSTISESDEVFPYPDLAFQRTTWKEWRQAHPDTDVYLGQ